MGRDKALLDIEGTPLALRVAAQIGKVCGSVSLVGDPIKYGHLTLPVVPDAFPGEGPLAGIEAALRSTTADFNLVVACDMPELNGSMLEALFAVLERETQAECALPEYEDGRTEPLCAVYHRRCHPAILNALEAGVRRVKDVLQTLELTYIPVAASAPFANLNTPEDLRKYTHG
ncbi:MAG: molybdenum cofactor guanylyltransferase [Bryobacterales bacterium]|jgi:molybdopterin-guanine dinucleotide biosynthesis protein A|nr:molybdenum cofactor guanylyltransferase [Bryobacterales bacterium]